MKPRTSMNITVISRASPPSSIALWRALQPRQQFRGEILSKRLADELLLLVGRNAQRALDRDVHRDRGERRIDRIQQQAEMREREPRPCDCQHQCDDAGNQRETRAERKQHHSDEGRQQHRDDDLEPVRPVGTADEILRENLFDQLRMHRNAGHDCPSGVRAHRQGLLRTCRPGRSNLRCAAAPPLPLPDRAGP